MTDESREWRERGNQLYQQANDNYQDTEKKDLYARSVKYYRMALQKADNNEDNARKASKNLAKALWKLGGLQSKNDMYLEAMEQFTGILSGGDPSWRKRLLEDAKACLKESVKCVMASGENDEKIKHLSKLSSMAPTEEMKAICCCQLARVLYDEGNIQLELQRIEKALVCYNDCYSPIAMAKQHSSGSGGMDRLSVQVAGKKLNVYGKQHIATGKASLTLAISRHKAGTFDEGLVFAAMDAFTEAIIIADEKDPEVEAASLSYMGQMFYEIFDQKVDAKKYFKQCHVLTEGLPNKSFTLRDWYTKCGQYLAKYAETVVKKEEEKRLKDIEELLRAEREILDEGNRLHGSDIPRFVTYIHKHFPTTKFKLPTMIEMKSMDRAGLKSLVRKAVAAYHGDKETSNDKKAKLLRTEITKELNGMMERLKL